MLSSSGLIKFKKLEKVCLPASVNTYWYRRGYTVPGDYSQQGRKAAVPQEVLNGSDLAPDRVAAPDLFTITIQR